MEATRLSMQFKDKNMCIDIQEFIEPKWCITATTWLCSLLKWLDRTFFYMFHKNERERTANSYIDQWTSPSPLH